MKEWNRQITLVARPEGPPKSTDFKLVETPVPTLGSGELLTRTIYLSLDPYMRGRMNEARGYADGVRLGDVMVGGTVSEVVESNNTEYQIGDLVLGMEGWQEYSVSNGVGLRKLNPDDAPISTALGVLGMPGLSAYVGLLDIGKPRRGETVVVSAASGAVGAVVGQIAKIKGCRVIGVAGAPEKCDYVERQLGFDACVSRFDDAFPVALKEACPDGIDVYFENTGGKIFEAVLPLLNTYARVPICGRIAGYSGQNSDRPNLASYVMYLAIVKRLTFQGFLVFDHYDRESDFLRDVQVWIRTGQLVYREDILYGLEHTVEGFQGLLQGKNFGKLLVRVSEDPTL